MGCDIRRSSSASCLARAVDTGRPLHAVPTSRTDITREGRDHINEVPDHLLFTAGNGSSYFVDGRGGGGGGGGGIPLHPFCSHAIVDESGLIKRCPAEMRLMR